MKSKDLMYLMLAVAILLVAGYIGYTQLVPKKTSAKTVQVEKVGEIPSDFDTTALAQLTNPEKVKDFTSPVDLTGLDNKAIFGP